MSFKTTVCSLFFASMSCFDDINIQNVVRCPARDNASGLKTKIYYAPIFNFDTIDLPTLRDTYASFKSIAEDGISFKNGATWNSIDVLIGENELKQILVGSDGFKKVKTELEMFIPGFTEDIVGFIDSHRNMPMVFMVVDAVGNHWVIGNLKTSAYIESADMTSAKKYDENSGAAAKVTCNSSVFYFGGPTSTIPEEEFFREFTYEFNYEFK